MDRAGGGADAVDNGAGVVWTFWVGRRPFIGDIRRAVRAEGVVAVCLMRIGWLGCRKSFGREAVVGQRWRGTGKSYPV